MQSQPKGSGFWNKMARQREDATRERTEERRRQEESARPGLETKCCLHLAAYGTDDVPVGVRFSRITIDSRTWAASIVRAATAWKRFPGLAALEERPLPEQCLGFDAGRRVLEVAADTEAVEEVAREIEAARAALGPYDPGPLRREPYGTSELGLWDFFIQLSRHFDGERWAPPRRPEPSAEAIVPSEAPIIAVPPGHSPTAATVWGVRQTGRKISVVVAEPGRRVSFEAKALVRLFLLVANQGGRDVGWREVSRELVAQGKVRGFEIATLQRTGRRIKKALGVLGWYWQQDGAGARWCLPERNDAAVLTE